MLYLPSILGYTGTNPGMHWIHCSTFPYNFIYIINSRSTTVGFTLFNPIWRIQVADWRWMLENKWHNLCCTEETTIVYLARAPWRQNLSVIVTKVDFFPPPNLWFIVDIPYVPKAAENCCPFQVLYNQRIALTIILESIKSMWGDEFFPSHYSFCGRGTSVMSGKRNYTAMNCRFF